MGSGQRFLEFRDLKVPGPGEYKITGFTDNLLKKVDKKKKPEIKKEELKANAFENMEKMMTNIIENSNDDIHDHEDSKTYSDN